MEEHRSQQNPRSNARRRKLGKLIKGLSLLLNHPHIASLSCDTCEKWMIDLSTGSRVLFAGQPVSRPAKSPTPCHDSPKCQLEDLHSRNPQAGRKSDLNFKNTQLLNLFFELKATGGQSFPPHLSRDRNVVRSLQTIQQILDSHERGLTRDLIHLLSTKP